MFEPIFRNEALSLDGKALKMERYRTVIRFVRVRP